MDKPVITRGPRVKREVPWINTGKVCIGITYTPPPAPMSRDAEILQSALLKRRVPRTVAHAPRLAWLVPLTALITLLFLI